MDPAQVPSGFEVLVFNTNEDIVDMLRLALGEEGYRVGAQHLVSFRKGEADVLEVLEQAQPRVVIFDVAPPYQANWAFFRLVSATVIGQSIRWLVTTTNVRALTEEAGESTPDDLIEIWGKPYDLELIVERVKQLAGPPGDEERPAAAASSGLGPPLYTAPMSRTLRATSPLRIASKPSLIWSRV